MKRLIGIAVALAGSAAALLAGTTAARADDPLMGKAPWNFTPVNRASMAVVIKNVEDGNGTGGSGSGGSGTTIVCGGNSGGGGTGGTGSAASATANNNCIIINGSNGSIVNVDQNSDGDQSANSNSNSNATTNNNAAQSGSIDEVAAILAGRGS